MVTSAALYHVLHFFHITIDIRNVCVFLAPLFSSFTAIVTYHLTKELKVCSVCSPGPDSGCALSHGMSKGNAGSDFFILHFCPPLSLSDRMLVLDSSPPP